MPRSTKNSRLKNPLAQLLFGPPLCAVCSKPNPPSKCKCGTVWYCDRSCQKRHWKEEHKRECGKQPNTNFQFQAPRGAPAESSKLIGSTELVRGVCGFTHGKDNHQLLEMLVDPSGTIRAAAVKALKQQELTELTEMRSELVQLLQSDRPGICWAAAELLAELPASEILELTETLLDALTDAEWYVKGAVLRALSKLPLEVLSGAAETIESKLTGNQWWLQRESSRMLRPAVTEESLVRCYVQQEDAGFSLRECALSA